MTRLHLVYSTEMKALKNTYAFLMPQVIDAIAVAISSTAGCSLLDVDPGASSNRTVYTFVGSPQDVVEGALNAARQAFTLIDMSKHSGERCPENRP